MRTLLLMLALLFTSASVAEAQMGGHLYNAGGNVTVTVIPFSAAFTSEL